MLNANFKGAYFTVQKALPFLNKPASIIFNGSVNALTRIANSSLYTANKGAIHALARALAAELIGRGIRVNTITMCYAPVRASNKHAAAHGLNRRQALQISYMSLSVGPRLPPFEALGGGPDSGPYRCVAHWDQRSLLTAAGF